MLEATLGLATIVRATRIEALEPDSPLVVPFTMTAGGAIPVAVLGRARQGTTSASGAIRVGAQGLLHERQR